MIQTVPKEPLEPSGSQKKGCEDMLQGYNKFMDRICKVIEYVIAVIVFAAILISFVEVVRRYLFDKVFVWSDEFIRYSLIYVGLVGGAVAYRYGQLVCFDSLLNKIPENARLACGIISDLISLVLLVFCFWLSIKNLMAKSVLSALSTGMKIPMVVPYFAFTLGFFLMILFCIGGLANRIDKHRRTKLAGKEE